VLVILSRPLLPLSKEGGTLTTYAYSRIRYDAEVDKPASQAAGQVGTVTKVIEIQPGETVTQDKVGVDDETWESWYRDQVIGDEPYPDDLGENESLNQYRMRKATEAAEAVASGAPIREKKAPAKKEDSK
jgi:hypothetical protein